MTYVPATAVLVYAWGRRVGAVALNPVTGGYGFEYDPDWIAGGIQLSPWNMPARRGVFEFGRLSQQTWHGLPPLLADTLPDAFGNRLVNEWMREQGIAASQVTALDRLAYAADRSIGALEYRPPAQPQAPVVTSVELADLVVAARAALDGTLDAQGANAALTQLIAVGTSAGGARAKALISYDPETGHIASPHGPELPGHEPWLIKLDGVQAGATTLDGRTDVLGAGAPYGRIEYAYHRMATAAGVDMAQCHLLEENGRAHFMTRRFDRTADGSKVHVITLCALSHLDFNAPGEHSYDDYLEAVARLELGPEALAQAFRRMVFNVVAVNRDDHTKNLAFTVDRTGTWGLAPAYDLAYSHNPTGEWTVRHQMRVNGKVDHITVADLYDVAERNDVRGYRGIVREVFAAVDTWPQLAAQAGVPQDSIDRIQADITALRPTGLRISAANPTHRPATARSPH